MNKLATTLAAARTAKGWTQDEFAARVGLTQAVVSRYERGHRIPDLPNLKRLARALGVPLASLVEVA